MPPFIQKENQSRYQKPCQPSASAPKKDTAALVRSNGPVVVTLLCFLGCRGPGGDPHWIHPKHPLGCRGQLFAFVPNANLTRSPLLGWLPFWDFYRPCWPCSEDSWSRSFAAISQMPPPRWGPALDAPKTPSGLPRPTFCICA